ncbi:hypothetical protein [Oceanibaculum indicum]|uniref:Uncharacterized protein n=1 Tax=Oceanibaculum indicum TaxID=526216 RepID=A0A420WR79_9PROT|nr:hypothetical protein [Oceanibaculum indicum]RKQ73490.1 hypothetical protein BCL74_1279 [Oceanibaculum indicum]
MTPQDYGEQVEAVYRRALSEMRAVAPGRPMALEDLPAIETIWQAATDDLVAMARGLAMRGGMLNSRHGRRKFHRDAEAPLRQAMARPLRKLQNEARRLGASLQQADEYFTVAIKEALHATD